DSPTIKMRIPDGTKIDSIGTFSPVHRINGFPWRLHVYPSCYGGHLSLALICDKSTESYLWKCNAAVTIKFAQTKSSVKKAEYSFVSWNGSMVNMADFERTCKKVGVDIETKEDGESFRVKPSLDPLSDARDGILVVGDGKIHVNKKSLASQSSYFSALFFGGFKESNQEEININDVEHKDLDNLFRLMYEFVGQSMTKENVEKIVELSQRFDLKIVEDRVVNFLLGCDSISIHKKLLMSEQLRLETLKTAVLLEYTCRNSLIGLRNSAEYSLISPETVKIMFEKCCQFI
ncbi:hypothetical protein PFISCL1PPCAC_12300, partial [Pristionchus fissidentatus]